MNYRENVTTLCSIQSYWYKCPLVQNVAIAHLVERSAVDEGLEECLVHESLHYLSFFYFFFIFLFLITFTLHMVLVCYRYYFKNILLDIIMTLLTFSLKGHALAVCLNIYVHGLSARGNHSNQKFNKTYQYTSCLFFNYFRSVPWSIIEKIHFLF